MTEDNVEKPSLQDTFPILNDVVTMENCQHYLDMMSQFQQIFESFESHEDLLQMYLVAAEERYEVFFMEQIAYPRSVKEIPIGKTVI